MFDGLYTVLKDFFWFICTWAFDMPNVWLATFWGMLPEDFTQSENMQMLLDAVIVANHWFPLREGYALAVNILGIRVFIALLKTFWRFVPILGA